MVMVEKESSVCSGHQRNMFTANELLLQNKTHPQDGVGHILYVLESKHKASAG